MALKIGTNFGNNYEVARSILSTRQLFNQEDWEYNAINGNLDAYIDAVYDTDASMVEKLNREYNYEYADSKTRTWALFNEKYGDKTVEQTGKYLRTRYKKDEDGNYVLVNGKPQEETYYASDYDYYKEIIKEHNDENQQLYLRKLEQQAKDEIHPIAQFFASLFAETGEVVSGLWSGVDSLITGIYALGDATVKAIQGENWADTYTAAIGNDNNYFLGSKKLEYLLTEFERKYTTMRDIDGNLTSAGGFFVGLANSAGQMIPALLTSLGVSKIGTALGWSEKAVGISVQASSSAVFYGSMTVDNIHDTYQYFKQNGMSISSAAIIGNAVLKSALQLIIELGLSKALNHFSKLDQLVFGRGAGQATAGTATSLSKSLFNRVMGDFAQEGMEEVFQDTSDWLVDRVFAMFDENFGELTSISAEDLMMSFIAGGIMSLSGHALSIAKRSVLNAHALNTTRHNAKVELTGKGKMWKGAEANPLVGAKENGKAKRLNSALAYEYSLNMQAFMQNFAEILELGKNFVDTDTDIKFEDDINSFDYGKQKKSNKIKRYEKGQNPHLVYKGTAAYEAYQSAVAEMYIAYRLIGSIYNTDPDAFAKANEILTKVQEMADLDKFNAKLMNERVASLVGETMHGIQADNKAVINKLKEAGISRVKGVYNKNTPITDASLDEKIREALEELVTNDNIDRVVVTEDGKHLVLTDNVLFVQLKQLENGGTDSIYESMAEETMVNALVDGQYHGIGIKEVTAIYREVSGRPDATEHEAALSLFLNDSFFRIVLATANKDTLHLLDSLIAIEKKVVPDKQRTAKYKQKLNQVIDNMHRAFYEYALYQSAVDPNDISILTTEERKRIRQTRWCKNLYRRVISKTAYKKLIDNDWKVLTNRVNALPVDKSVKEKLLKDLKSDNANVRKDAMNAIAARYKNIFTSMYDGKTYMPDNSTPNRVFNSWLQQNGLTIETLKSGNVNDEVKKTITIAFDEFNVDNLIKFYQAQFGTICDNAYTFTIDDKNNVGIYETKTKIQVGFSEYKNAYEAKDWLVSRNITEGTNIERTGRRHDELSKLLHPNLSAATAAYTTIDDVIVNPMLLSDSVKQKIADKHGEVNSETTFRYLQDYFIHTTKNTTVIVLQDGTYAFGNIRPMQKLLRNPDRKINADDRLTIQDLIAERYLYGRLADISITKVTDKSSKAEQRMMKGSIAAYDASTNTIYLNVKYFANASQEMIQFAILHEFQHAMQYETGMNLGLNVNWLLATDKEGNPIITKSARDKLTKDVRTHCPELFDEKSYGENKLITSGSDIEARIVQESIYHCSGESTAFGVDAERMLNFYPFVVAANTAGVETLKTPWGTQYNLSNAVPMSIAIRDVTGKLIEILSTDEYKDYFKDASSKAYYTKLKDATTEAFDEFDKDRKRANKAIVKSHQTVQRIPAILNYLHQYIGTNTNIADVKQRAIDAITPDVKDQMLHQMYDQLGISASYDAFLNMSIPVIRIQNNVVTNDDNTFLSFSAIKHSPVDGHGLAGVINYNLSRVANVHPGDTKNIVVLAGTIKPKEVVGYLANRLTETLIPEKIASTFKTYKVSLTSEELNTVNAQDIMQLNSTFDIVSTVNDIVYDYDDQYNTPKMIDDEILFHPLQVLDQVSHYEYNDMIYNHPKYGGEEEFIWLAFKAYYGMDVDEYNHICMQIFENDSFDVASDNSDFLQASKKYATDVLYYVYDFSSRMSKQEFINSEIFVISFKDTKHDIVQIIPVDNVLMTDQLNEALLYYGLYYVNVCKLAIKDIAGMIDVDRKPTFYANKANLQYIDVFTVDTRIEDDKLVSTTDYQPRTSLGSVDEDIDMTKVKSMAASTENEDEDKKSKKKSKTAKTDKPKRQEKQRTGAKGLDRIYVSQAMGKGTALEKYGYTGKYKRTYMSKGTYDFMRRFDETLLFKNEDGKLGDTDEKLLTALKSGKATSSDILDYFRDAEQMNEKMFALINDSFFHNKFITTFDELQKRVLESGQYYALRTIMRIAKLDDKFMENADEDLFTHAVKLLSRLNGKVTYNGKTVDINRLFEQISTRYNNNDVAYSERLLRRLWMQYYDGTAATGGYIAGVARWAAYASVNVTGEGTSRVRKSTNETVGGTDLTMEDVVADTNDDFAQLFDNMSTTQKIQQIQIMLSLQSGIDFENVDKMDDKKRKKFMQWFHDIGIKLEELSADNLDKYYEKQYRKLTDSQRQVIMRMSLALEAGNVTYAQLKEKEAAKLQKIATTSEDKMTRPSSAIVASMRGMLRTIKNRVPPQMYKQILKDNSDILTDDLTLKTDDMLETVNKRKVYKSADKLQPYLDRIKAIVQDAKDGAYTSQTALKAKRKMDAAVNKIRADYERTIKRYTTGKNTKIIRYEVNDNVIDIQTDKAIPRALRQILDNSFTKTAATNVQFLSDKEAEGKSEEQKARHVKANLSSFVEANAKYLVALTQSDVDAIIDFYLHSEIIPPTNKARQYVATRIYLLSYLLTQKLGALNTVGSTEWVLTDEQRSAVTEYLQDVNVSIPAAMLSAWKSTLDSFKPERLIISSLAKSSDIEFSIEDIDNLADAVSSADPKRIEAAKERMYSNGLKKYVQTSKKMTFDAFLGKVINFERMCMLSGPGTWVRNWTSNIIVQGGNWTSGKIGSLISKVFPEKWKQHEGQYQIVGTKVDTATKNFVTKYIVESGVLRLLSDTISKYDTRKSKQASVGANEVITELLEESARTRILYDNGYNNKLLDLANKGLGKMLSDNRWINKQTIYYSSRTLIEDNVDLSQGLTKAVIEHLADAYRMAAQDYMHKSNIFNDIEAKIREKCGMKVYFLYKQIMPFASAGWNWFVEGLNYTPIGLIKAIVQYAKLENTITKLENAQQKGDFSGIPAEFAQYRAIRNLGKGVLGTIGCIIGVLLGAFGIAGIDDEDDKYKLHIGDVYVDISSIFGTQGILMGITVTSSIVNSIQKSKNGEEVNVADELWSIFKTTLDATFADSTLDDVVGTFRYSSSVGDWVSSMPFTIVGMLVPNFLKQLMAFAPTKSVQYNTGIQGKLEKMVMQNLPVLAYAFPKQVDPYTGETQVPYVASGFIQLLNKLMPFDIAPYKFSDIEKEAMSLGLKKGQLTGSYDIDGQKIKLKSSEVHTANTYYGKLNKKDLEAFTKNKTSYTVWDEKKNKYVTLKYSQMTDKQKANVIDRIMSNNASLAKIYILTSTGRYKYFASESEYTELRKAGITTNVYKATETKSGFIK